MPSSSHLVLIPSYNTGTKVLETVRNALAVWQPVWVVVDGSTDGTAETLQALEGNTPELKVFILPCNQGKGAAVLHGLQQAAAAGYTHVLTMDADGQHPAGLIPEFMAMSIANPDAVVLGKPVFDASAPALRVNGRKVSNWWANLETLGAGIGDSLFGFRVYPVKPLCGLCKAAHGCAVLTSTLRWRCACAGMACARSICWRRCAISGRRRAGVALQLFAR